MSELQVIENALKRAARRRRLEQVWHGFWQALLVGGSIWLLVFAAYKLFPIPPRSLLFAGLLSGLVLLAGLVVAAWRKGSLLETARWVDSNQRLQERLSTALEV